MSDSTTEQTVTLESQMMASLDKVADSDTPPAAVEAKADESDKAEKEVEVAETEAVEEPESEQEATEEAEDESIDPDFKAAKDKHLPTLDDIPVEARPLVEKKLKDMERGFTRAMQEARQYRQEKAQVDQDTKYRTENPDIWLADYIGQHPEVIDKVNSELEKRADPTYAEAQAMKRDAAKAQAEANAVTASQAEAYRQERIEHVSDYVETKAKDAGVPTKFIESAVAAAILSKPESERDISDAEIDSIIEDYGKEYRKAVGVVKANKTKEYAKAKAADAKGGVIPPRSSTATESPSTAKPKNLEEAMNMALDRIGAAA